MVKEVMEKEAPRQYRVHIAANGRINLPSQLRKAAKVKDGDELILTLKGDIIQIQPFDQVITEAQNLVAQYFAEDDLTENLKAMRAQDAKREEDKFIPNDVSL